MQLLIEKVLPSISGGEKKNTFDFSGDKKKPTFELSGKGENKDVNLHLKANFPINDSVTVSPLVSYNNHLGIYSQGIYVSKAFSF